MTTPDTPPPPPTREVATTRRAIEPAPASEPPSLHDVLFGEPLVRFNARQNTLDLKTSNPADIYPIPYEDCKTPAAVSQWISHLSHKQWFTGAHAGQLAVEVLQRNNLPIYP